MRYPYLCVGFFIITLLMSSVVQARDLVIVLSPHMDEANSKKTISNVINFLTTLEPGDNVILINGYSLENIGDFKIPIDSAYNSPKARMGVNRKTVSKLLKFTKNQPAEPVIKEALRIPQVLRYIAENYAPLEPLDILMIGSPLYDDAREPAFSMAAPSIPSDAHLLESTAITPFGTVDTPELLANMRVHFAYTNSQNLNDQNIYFIKRFWTLFIERQGGSLLSFANNPEIILQRVQKTLGKDIKISQHNFGNAQPGKLEMIRLHTQRREQSIFDRKLSEKILSTFEIRQGRDVEISLSWDCATCDLDLYALPFPGAKPLFYANSSSPEGSYWKDYRSSNTALNGYEIIEFHSEIDLEKLIIAINFFDGIKIGGVKGELRLSVNGETFAKKFHIKNETGNKGENMIQALQSAQSVNANNLVINPMQLLKIK